MIRQMIKELGYNSNLFEDQIIANEKHLAYFGQMWDIDDDIIMDILYNEFHDDVKGACEVVDMLEEKYGWNICLYWSIRFRDKEIK